MRGGNIEAFYLIALSYGHYLWLKGYSGHAILAITRALYANHPSEDYPGNPRISFQHQATRLRGDRVAFAVREHGQFGN